MNYNPYLKDQMTYLSENNMMGPNPSSGLTQYTPDSVLSGQNVVSMFGTNNYLDQLNKHKNKYGKTMPKERLEQLNQEIADYELDQINKDLKARQNINAANNNNNNGGGSGAPGGFNTSKSSPSKSSSYSSSRGSNFGGRFHNARGGIASL